MEKAETIELIDFLRTIWKWKWLIIIFTLACSIFVGIISFSMPKIYGVSMVIEPGVLDIGPDGKFIYLDSSLNIKSKIDSQAYNSKIFKKLNVDPREMKLKFKTIQPEKTNTIEIRLEVKDVSKGIQALTTLFHELSEEYQHYVDSRKSELGQKIAMNKRQINVGAGEKKYLEKEIAMAKTNTNNIIKERNMLINKGGSNVDRLSLLIYTNIIQQNMAHYNDLNKQLGEVLANIETMKSEMGSLKIKRESMENIKLIQPPQSSLYPIKPKKILNITLAFVIGLIISVILAFFLEYLHKMGVYPKSSTTRGQIPSVKNQEK